MGNKIGEYIHLNYLNYLNNGINKNSEEKNSPNIIKIMNKQKLLIQQKSKNNKNYKKSILKNELEQQLNFFNPNSINNTLKMQFSQQQIQYMESIVKKIVLDELAKYSVEEKDINWTTLDLNRKLISNLDKNFQLTYKQDKITINDKTNEYFNSTILRRLKGLKEASEALTKLENKPDGLTDGQKKIQNAINNLNKRYGDIIIELEKISNNYTQGMGAKKITDPNTKVQKIKYFNAGGKGQYSENFIKKLNETYSLIQSNVTNYVKGILGEAYAAACIAVIKEAQKNKVELLTSNFEEKVRQLFKDKNSKMRLGWVGIQTGVTTLKSDNLAANLFVKQEKRNQETQNKVDLIFNLPSAQNFTINASIKNYNLYNNKRKITLLTGRSILALLQDDISFLNHYLNITSVPPAVITMPKGNTSQEISPLIEMRPITLANRTLMMSIAFYAIAGGTYKTHQGISGYTNQADIFVVNNTNTSTGGGQGYKVYFIDDILNEIQKDLTDLKEQMFSKYITIDNFEEKQTWVNQYVQARENTKSSMYKAAYSRISAILQQLHNFHLHVQISSSILNQIDN